MARFSFLFFVTILIEQASEIFLVPQAAYAEESALENMSRQIQAGQPFKYEVNIRKSLELQKDFGNPALSYRTLDRLYGKIEKKVKPKSKYNKKEAIETLKTIGSVLKKEGNFEYRKNILLIEGLKRQKDGKRLIDCDDYSSLYLVAGERLGLSLAPVYASNHLFLVCRLDDSTRFYWEPTLGAEKDDDFYREWLNIPDDCGYPKILSENEFEAIQFCNLGAAWFDKGDYKKAAEFFGQAVELNPNYAEAFNNLGAAYARQGKLDLAMGYYEQAVALNPNYAVAFSNTGVAFYRLGHLQKAVEYFEKAIEVNPQYERAYNYKFAVLMKNGERQKAFEFVNKTRERNPSSSPQSKN